MTKRDKVFFDLTFGKQQQSRRVIFQLYNDIVPITAENFKVLCTRQGKQGYKGSSFHRIITNFMAQGGDFTRGDGTGGKSIYGPKFKDESFKMSCKQPYSLAMANCGPNTNGSQFFITLGQCPWIVGKFVTFGRVIDGFEVIQTINNSAASDNGKPNRKVVITNSGILE